MGKPKPFDRLDVRFNSKGELKIKCPRALFDLIADAIANGCYETDDDRVEIRLGSSRYALNKIVYSAGPEQPPC